MVETFGDDSKLVWTDRQLGGRSLVALTVNTNPTRRPSDGGHLWPCMKT